MKQNKDLNTMCDTLNGHIMYMLCDDDYQLNTLSRLNVKYQKHIICELMVLLIATIFIKTNKMKNNSPY